MHRDHDLLALAAALAGVKRRENPQRHADAGGFVADAQSLRPRRAAVTPRGMGPSGDAVVAGSGIPIISVGSPLTVTARTGVNQPRVETLRRIIVQAEPLHRALLVILDEHVGARDELAREIDAPVGLQIEDDALFVDVDPQELIGVLARIARHP